MSAVVAERHGHLRRSQTDAAVSDQSRDSPIISVLRDTAVSARVHTVCTWKLRGGGCLLGQHLLLHEFLNESDENCANLAQANEPR